MENSLSIFGEKMTNDDSVIFSASINGKVTPCKITRNALAIIGRTSEQGLLEVFDRNREKIANRVREHLAVDPLLANVVLSETDF